MKATDSNTRRDCTLPGDFSSPVGVRGGLPSLAKRGLIFCGVFNSHPSNPLVLSGELFLTGMPSAESAPLRHQRTIVNRNTKMCNSPPREGGDFDLAPSASSSRELASPVAPRLSQSATKARGGAKAGLSDGSANVYFIFIEVRGQRTNRFCCPRSGPDACLALSFFSSLHSSPSTKTSLSAMVSPKKSSATVNLPSTNLPLL